jgi:hypothetical protein
VVNGSHDGVAHICGSSERCGCGFVYLFGGLSLKTPAVSGLPSELIVSGDGIE